MKPSAIVMRLGEVADRVSDSILDEGEDLDASFRGFAPGAFFFFLALPEIARYLTSLNSTLMGAP